MSHSVRKPRSDMRGVSNIGLLMTLLAWFAVAGLLALAFQDQLERFWNPNPQVRSTHQGSAIEVVLQPNRQGHYVATGRINDERVVFMLDTGATQVAIPPGVAERLNLERGRAFQVQTANGIATAYATEIATLQLGDIQLRQVGAHISPGLEGETILLGMSALQQLDWSRQGGELRLRYNP
ncbi:TIGR02281 family clan AA aspartic protease [Salinispirillum sp. LH 10-3-1]|uniref:TIGR02281 family clan AA aspartic protease n=1 Tax=Salinispirillum sp. LH 10-3-1 TaxID=2952525 RepID=A0AB38YDG7_9GAMM